jgi:hypothetical protein
MSATKPLIHLISQTNWEWDELSGAQNYEVVKSFGLEVPSYVEDDSWRIPQEPYTHFMLSGARMPVEAPGPLWLDGVPDELKQRSVVTVTAKEVLNMVHDPRAFWKFAEAKSNEFIAQSYSLEHVKDFITSNKVPSDSFMQFSGHIEIVNEYRFFVVHGEIVASSLYVSHDEQGNSQTIYDGAIVDTQELKQATRFLVDALSQLDIPDSLVIDVAKTKKGFAILEANPSWCSGWYNCEINSVAKAIYVSNHVNVSSKWLYKPDALLINKFNKRRPLKINNVN